MEYCCHWNLVAIRTFVAIGTYVAIGTFRAHFERILCSSWTLNTLSTLRTWNTYQKHSENLSTKLKKPGRQQKQTLRTLSLHSRLKSISPNHSAGKFWTFLRLVDIFVEGRNFCRTSFPADCRIYASTIMHKLEVLTFSVPFELFVKIHVGVGFAIGLILNKIIESHRLP